MIFQGTSETNIENKYYANFISNFDWSGLICESPNIMKMSKRAERSVQVLSSIKEFHTKDVKKLCFEHFYYQHKTQIHVYLCR